jgi:hypothetical protein
MLRRVALLRTDISEELSGSFIRVTRIGELGTTLAVQLALFLGPGSNYFVTNARGKYQHETCKKVKLSS